MVVVPEGGANGLAGAPRGRGHLVERHPAPAHRGAGAAEVAGRLVSGGPLDGPGVALDARPLDDIVDAVSGRPEPRRDVGGELEERLGPGIQDRIARGRLQAGDWSVSRIGGCHTPAMTSIASTSRASQNTCSRSTPMQVRRALIVRASAVTRRDRIRTDVLARRCRPVDAHRAVDRIGEGKGPATLGLS